MMDPSAILVLHELDVPYDQLIRYQWDHVIGKRVCSPHAGRTKMANPLKATHRLYSAAIVQLYTYSVSLRGQYSRHSGLTLHSRQEEWTFVWSRRPWLVLPKALYVIVGIGYLPHAS
jgi:hypothetical protein